MSGPLTGPTTSHLELWLVRHAQTSSNVAGVLPSAATDPPLDEVGTQQARALGGRLGRLDADLVVSSDARRARATASLAMPDARTQVDPRLREADLGRLGGRRWDELTPNEAALLAAWHRDGGRPAPDGESGDDLRRRLRAWLDDLPRRGTVVAVTHAGTLAGLLHLLLGASTGHRPWTGAVGTAGVCRLHVGDDLVTLDLWNDRSHVAVVGPAT